LISKYATPLDCDITTLEVVGGGSARCMLADVFL
ncbi:arginine deiminase-related protein, partial [Francisella tularensis subsp. holarctica]